MSWCAKRELLREYGLGGPGVRGFWNIEVFGPGLLYRGGPIALLENPDGVIDPFLFGVGARLGCFRKGDSGRGSDGLLCGLNTGLGARAPGPTDCENLGMEGVSGLKLGLSRVDRLSLPPYDGVVGVGGSLPVEVGELRFDARCTGKKMPAPGTDVVKYCSLYDHQPWTQVAKDSSVPLEITIVLPLFSKRLAQLYASEDTWFVADTADVLHNTVHAAGNVDNVAYIEGTAVKAHPAVWSGGVSHERVERGFACDSGAGGHGEIWLRSGVAEGGSRLVEPARSLESHPGNLGSRLPCWCVMLLLLQV